MVVTKHRRSGTICTCLAFVFGCGSAAAGEIAATAWGPIVEGLSIATTVDGAQLRVFFRNSSAQPIGFLVGGRTGIGSIYKIAVTAINPKKERCELLNTTVTGVAGSLVPIVIQLAPRATDSIPIDLRKLVCVRKTENVTLDRLLSAGHGVSTRLSVTSEGNRWANVRSGWVGEVSSPVFRPAR